MCCVRVWFDSALSPVTWAPVIQPVVVAGIRPCMSIWINVECITQSTLSAFRGTHCEHDGRLLEHSFPQGHSRHWWLNHCGRLPLRPPWCEGVLSHPCSQRYASSLYHPPLNLNMASYRQTTWAILATNNNRYSPSQFSPSRHLQPPHFPHSHSNAVVSCFPTPPRPFLLPSHLSHSPHTLLHWGSLHISPYDSHISHPTTALGCL